MRIYSQVITERNVRETVAKTRDIYIISIRSFRPRGGGNGIEIYCGGNGFSRSAHDGEHFAATWDAYGNLMAELYMLDPSAKIAWYKTFVDFVEKTAHEHKRIQTFNAPHTRRCREHTAPWLRDPDVRTLYCEHVGNGDIFETLPVAA